MNDTTPQTAQGKVLWHFTMSLDGFVAGPNHEMDWMTGTNRPGLIDEYVTTTGAVLGGRTGWDIAAALWGSPTRAVSSGGVRSANETGRLCRTMNGLM